MLGASWLSTALVQVALLGGDPHNGKFTLEQATRGLLGEKTLPLVADIKTSKGTLSCELLSRQAPRAVANFVGLARGVRAFRDPKTRKWVKRPFYDGLTFYKVDPAGLIVGGDIAGDGSGSPGYRLAADPPPPRVSNKSGVMVMLGDGGPGVHGSQFAITTTIDAKLGPRDVILGYCVPQSVIDAIAEGQRGAGSVEIVSVDVKRKADVTNFGMIGLLNTGDETPRPWPREDTIGKDDLDSKGNSWGAEIGEAFGSGGSGGLGLNDLGKSPATGKGARPRGVTVQLGPPTVEGPLPPEVITRILKTGVWSRLKMCYEDGRTRVPGLTGTMTVRLTIGTDGSVKDVKAVAEALNDAGARACALHGHYGLSFPPPQTGTVTATYRITFSAP